MTQWYLLKQCENICGNRDASYDNELLIYNGAIKREKREREYVSIKYMYQLSHKIILQNTSILLLALWDICCFFYKKNNIVNILDNF